MVLFVNILRVSMVIVQFVKFLAFSDAHKLLQTHMYEPIPELMYIN